MAYVMLSCVMQLSQIFMRRKYIQIQQHLDCQTPMQSVLENIISKKKATFILGDINICYDKQRRNKNIEYLEANNFKQLVKCATHLLGGHIDHAYLTGDQQVFKDVDIEQYSPYYTSQDHDGLLIILMYK